MVAELKTINVGFQICLEKHIGSVWLELDLQAARHLIQYPLPWKWELHCTPNTAVTQIC